MRKLGREAVTFDSLKSTGLAKYVAKLGKLEQCLRAALSMHRSPLGEDGEQQGQGVLAMAPGSVKAAKTALEARGWVDKSRRTPRHAP